MIVLCGTLWHFVATKSTIQLNGCAKIRTYHHQKRIFGLFQLLQCHDCTITQRFDHRKIGLPSKIQRVLASRFLTAGVTRVRVVSRFLGDPEEQETGEDQR